MRVIEINQKDEWERMRHDINSVDLYTSWTWSEYKKRQGWDVKHYALVSDVANKVISLFILKIRRLTFFKIALIQGGLEMSEVDDKYYAATEAILETISSQKIDMTIFQGGHRHNPRLLLALLRSKFQTVSHLRRQTLILKGLSELSMMHRLTKNWRHNLKRSMREDVLNVKEMIGFDDRKFALQILASMYDELAERRSFPKSIDIRLMQDLLVQDSQFTILVAYDSGKIVAVRVGYFDGGCGLDFLAASTEGAVKNYANYRLLWELIKSGANSGVLEFDCGGIDPSGNVGVFNFKKGLGGDFHMYDSLLAYAPKKWKLRLARIAFGLFH